MKSLVHLIPSDSASKRTKNRLSQHGPLFEEKGVQKTFFADGDWLLVKSEKTGWKGWLLITEIKEIKIEIAAN